MIAIDIIIAQVAAANSSLLLQGLFVTAFSGAIYYLRERNQGRSKKSYQDYVDNHSTR